MFSKPSSWLQLMLVVLVTGGAWIWWSRAPDGANAATGVAAQIGFRAPNFSLERLDGGKASLADFRGKPVLLNFWASWCGPCRAEMPAIQRVATRHADDGLVVLLINQAEDSDTIYSYLDSIGVRAPVLLDPEGAASTAYRVRALPTTFFIARDGKVQDMTIGGPMTEAYLETRIESLLRGP
ncbi:MAG: TlpA family protein disulfide reductase [Ardenticatenaceae bacterium]|nr:TlpA family protein disulfide reductase [Ardenticatenaceae bacterium]HBY95207.1 TlpA family protein disulfide reductase [Chloroflexota bacterium]